MLKHVGNCTFAGIAPKQLYYRGCVKTLPSGVDDGVNVNDIDSSGILDRVAKCRHHCAGRHAYLAYLNDKQMCSCLLDGDSKQLLSGLDATASCSDYSVFWTRNFETVPDYPIDLNVEVILPTEHNYVRPNETVIFKASYTTDEYVTLVYDFGDSINRTTKSNLISHAWRTEGSYQVKITANTRLMSETVLKTVNITWVEEGIAPEEVVIQVSPTENSREVELELTTIGKYERECSLDYGDGQTDELTVSTYIQQLTKSHQYEKPGFYDVVYTCQNEYGTTVDQAVAYAVNWDLEFETDPRYQNIDLDVVGAKSHMDVYSLTLNGDPLQAMVTDMNVVIQADEFLYSGEHIVRVMADDAEIKQRVFNLQEKISKVEITSNGAQVLPGDEIQFTYKIYGGDHIHVLIDYDDGTTERVYIPKGDNPTVVSRAHTYATLNHFKLSVTAANDVSNIVQKTDVSIEEPLVGATLKAQNVTVLGTSTVFSLLVDPDLPVDVTFNYGDGKIETVRMGQHGMKGPFTHTYTYSQYGIYRVYAIVHNNISQSEVWALHQVGENITMLDLYASRYRLLNGEELNITMDAPYGYPLVYNLDMGDGTIITVRRPLGYTGSFENDLTTMSVSQVIQDENSTAIILDRKARDVNIMPTTSIIPGDGEVLAVLSTPAPVTASSRGAYNDKVTVTYRYSREGTFSVKATVDNPFGGEETWLCPDVLILPKAKAQPDCSSVSIKVTNPSTRDAPLVTQRSKAITIPASVNLQCKQDASAYMVDYTWKANRNVMDDLWRPELQICESLVSSPDLVIPSNSLWYGLYRIRATAGVRNIEQVRTRRSVNGTGSSLEGSVPSLITADVDVYLRVDKSPLVADLANSTKKQDNFINIPVTIKADDSYDPDVNDRVNKTGMTGAIICYRDSKTVAMSKLSSAKVLEQGRLVAQNGAGTVKLYDVDCFVNSSYIEVHGWQAVLDGHAITTDSIVVFR